MDTIWSSRAGRPVSIGEHCTCRRGIVGQIEKIVARTDPETKESYQLAIGKTVGGTDWQSKDPTPIG